MSAVFGGTKVPTKYQAAILAAAAKYGMPPALLAAQLNAESGFDPNAVSPDGAIGLAQFLPSTAASVGIDPTNPTDSINGMAKLMSHYFKTYGSWQTALYAYHDGPGHASSPGPAGTSYAEKVLTESGVTATDSGGIQNAGLIPNPLSSLSSVIGRLNDKDFWKRIAYYMMGVALIVGGLVWLFRSTAGKEISKVMGVSDGTTGGLSRPSGDASSSPSVPGSGKADRSAGKAD
jgi:hypothetical protein